MQKLSSKKVTEWPEKAPQRSLFNALGIEDEELDKPIIGIANSWNEIVPGHMHLDKLAKDIKRGIHENGGLGLEFNTIALCDGIGMGHTGMRALLPSREIIADSIELTVAAHAFDGLVLLGSCDKIVPGMVMGGIRTNLPTIMVTGGPMYPGNFNDKKIDVSSVFEAVGSFKQGEISEKELKETQHRACPGPGSCAGMFTANTMACVVESLGLSVKGCATSSAESAKKMRQATRSGRKIMDLVEKDKKIHDILTEKSFWNAAMIDLALGGSTNTALHLPAIAKEAKIDFPLEVFNRFSEKIPHLVNMSPAGNHTMDDLDRSGGIPAVMKMLKEELYLGEETVDQTLNERIENVQIKENNVIRSKKNPVHKKGGLKILSGNLAPEKAVVKQSAVKKEMLRHKGPAKVFNGEEKAVKAIDNREIEKGDIVVIRYEGPKGGPGMKEMLTSTSRISGSKLEGEVALITDGRFSGASRGAAIGHISPEAIEGGPIAILKDNDQITIDIPAGLLEVDLSEKQMKNRLKKWSKPEIETQWKALDRYSILAESASRGAVLKDSKDF